MFSYLESERIRVVSSLLHQGVVHGGQGGLVALGVDLDLLDPDVLPEAQAHHIQVVTTITEGTCQLHKHCWRTTAESLACSWSLTVQVTVVCWDSVWRYLSFLQNPSCPALRHHLWMWQSSQTWDLSAWHTHTHTRTHTHWRRNVPTWSTPEMWST